MTTAVRGNILDACSFAILHLRWFLTNGWCEMGWMWLAESHLVGALALLRRPAAVMTIESEWGWDIMAVACRGRVVVSPEGGCGLCSKRESPVNLYGWWRRSHIPTRGEKVSGGLSSLHGARDRQKPSEISR